jgi:perosamine synthetase
MIPVFEPDFGEDEIAAVVDALRKGEISGSFGTYIPEFERMFARYVGCKHGIAVTSGTTALHLAVAAAGITTGDEVLISSSTNIATALAVAHNGASCVPIDSEPVTWNLDLDLIEPAISPRTRAIIPVHLYGHPVDMDRLMGKAREKKLLVIEDCAESHGATCRGKMTGSFGDMGCFSFYANKVITTGEGGMVVTNDDTLAERLRLLRNLAFTKPRFRHEYLGYNFRMTGYQAAMGVAQMKRVEKIVEKKRLVARTYQRFLENIDWLQLPVEMEWARNVYWMYAVVVKENAPIGRDRLQMALATLGIETRTFFCPMNLQPGLRALPGYKDRECPVASKLWETGFYLPSSPRLTEREIEQIAASIRDASNQSNS